MRIKVNLDRDRLIIEEMKRRITGLQAFVVNIYFLNRHGMERYRKLTEVAIAELARDGYYLPHTDASPIFKGRDEEGQVRIIRVDGPIRELVDVIKDEIGDVGDYGQRGDRFFRALKPELEPLLLLLTSYACYELVNEAV